MNVQPCVRQAITSAPTAREFLMAVGVLLSIGCWTSPPSSDVLVTNVADHSVDVERLRRAAYFAPTDTLAQLRLLSDLSRVATGRQATPVREFEPHRRVLASIAGDGSLRREANAVVALLIPLISVPVIDREAATRKYSDAEIRKQVDEAAQQLTTILNTLQNGKTSVHRELVHELQSEVMKRDSRAQESVQQELVDWIDGSPNVTSTLPQIKNRINLELKSLGIDGGGLISGDVRHILDDLVQAILITGAAGNPLDFHRQGFERVMLAFDLIHHGQPLFRTWHEWITPKAHERLVVHGAAAISHEMWDEQQDSASLWKSSSPPRPVLLAVVKDEQVLHYVPVLGIIEHRSRFANHDRKRQIVLPEIGCELSVELDTIGFRVIRDLKRDPKLELNIPHVRLPVGSPLTLSIANTPEYQGALGRWIRNQWKPDDSTKSNSHAVCAAVGDFSRCTGILQGTNDQLHFKFDPPALAPEWITAKPEKQEPVTWVMNPIGANDIYMLFTGEHAEINVAKNLCATLHFPAFRRDLISYLKDAQSPLQGKVVAGNLAESDFHVAGHGYFQYYKERPQPEPGHISPVADPERIVGEMLGGEVRINWISPGLAKEGSPLTTPSPQLANAPNVEQLRAAAVDPKLNPFLRLALLRVLAADRRPGGSSSWVSLTSNVAEEHTLLEWFLPPESEASSSASTTAPPSSSAFIALARSKSKKLKEELKHDDQQQLQQQLEASIGIAISECLLNPTDAGLMSNDVKDLEAAILRGTSVDWWEAVKRLARTTTAGGERTQKGIDALPIGAPSGYQLSTALLRPVPLEHLISTETEMEDSLAKRDVFCLNQSSMFSSNSTPRLPQLDAGILMLRSGREESSPREFWQINWRLVGATGPESKSHCVLSPPRRVTWGSTIYPGRIFHPKTIPLKGLPDWNQKEMVPPNSEFPCNLTGVVLSTGTDTESRALNSQSVLVHVRQSPNSSGPTPLVDEYLASFDRTDRSREKWNLSSFAVWSTGNKKSSDAPLAPGLLQPADLAFRELAKIELPDLPDHWMAFQQWLNEEMKVELRARDALDFSDLDNWNITNEQHLIEINVRPRAPDSTQREFVSIQIAGGLVATFVHSELKLATSRYREILSRRSFLTHFPALNLTELVQRNSQERSPLSQLDFQDESKITLHLPASWTRKTSPEGAVKVEPSLLTIWPQSRLRTAEAPLTAAMPSLSPQPKSEATITPEPESPIASILGSTIQTDVTITPHSKESPAGTTYHVICRLRWGKDSKCPRFVQKHLASVTFPWDLTRLKPASTFRQEFLSVVDLQLKKLATDEVARALGFTAGELPGSKETDTAKSAFVGSQFIQPVGEVLKLQLELLDSAEPESQSMFDWTKTRLLGLKDLEASAIDWGHPCLRHFLGKPTTIGDPPVIEAVPECLRSEYFATVLVPAPRPNGSTDKLQLAVLLPRHRNTKVQSIVDINWTHEKSLDTLRAWLPELNSDLIKVLSGQSNDSRSLAVDTVMTDFWSFLANIGATAQIKETKIQIVGTELELDATLSISIPAAGSQVQPDVVMKGTLALDRCKAYSARWIWAKPPKLDLESHWGSLAQKACDIVNAQLTSLNFGLDQNSVTVLDLQGSDIPPSDLRLCDLIRTAIKNPQSHDRALTLKVSGKLFGQTISVSGLKFDLDTLSLDASAAQLRLPADINGAIRTPWCTVVFLSDQKCTPVGLTQPVRINCEWLKQLTGEDLTVDAYIVIDLKSRRLFFQYNGSDFGGSIEAALYALATRAINSKLATRTKQFDFVDIGDDAAFRIKPDKLEVHLAPNDYRITAQALIRMSGGSLMNGDMTTNATIKMSYTKGRNPPIKIDDVYIRPSDQQVLMAAISAVLEHFNIDTPTLPTYDSKNKQLSFSVGGSFFEIGSMEASFFVKKKRLHCEWIDVQSDVPIVIPPAPLLQIRTIGGKFYPEGPPRPESKARKGQSDLIATAAVSMAGDDFGALFNIDGSIYTNLRQFQWIAADSGVTMLMVIPFAEGETLLDWSDGVHLTGEGAFGRGEAMAYSGNIDLTLRSPSDWGATLNGGVHILGRPVTESTTNIAPCPEGAEFSCNGIIRVPCSNATITVRGVIPTNRPKGIAPKPAEFTLPSADLTLAFSAGVGSGIQLQLDLSGRVEDGTKLSLKGELHYQVHQGGLRASGSVSVPRITDLDELKAGFLKSLVEVDYKRKLKLRPSNSHGPGVGGDGDRFPTDVAAGVGPEGDPVHGTRTTDNTENEPGGRPRGARQHALPTTTMKVVENVSADPSGHAAKNEQELLAAWVDLLQEQLKALDHQDSLIPEISTSVINACKQLGDSQQEGAAITPLPKQERLGNYIKTHWHLRPPEGVRSLEDARPKDENLRSSYVTDAAFTLLALNSLLVSSRSTRTDEAVLRFRKGLIVSLCNAQHEDGRWCDDLDPDPTHTNNWHYTHLSLLALRRALTPTADGVGASLAITGEDLDVSSNMAKLQQHLQKEMRGGVVSAFQDLGWNPRYPYIPYLSTLSIDNSFNPTMIDKYAVGGVQPCYDISLTENEPQKYAISVMIPLEDERLQRGILTSIATHGRTGNKYTLQQHFSETGNGCVNYCQWADHMIFHTIALGVMADAFQVRAESKFLKDQILPALERRRIIFTFLGEERTNDKEFYAMEHFNEKEHKGIPAKNALRFPLADLLSRLECQRIENIIRQNEQRQHDREGAK